MTTTAARGNLWSEVIAHGGREAALARQAAPELYIKSRGQGRSVAEASVGRWDPGMALKAQWLVDGKLSGKLSDVTQGKVVTLSPGMSNGKACRLELAVTGRKRGYTEEIRTSNAIQLGT